MIANICLTVALLFREDNRAALLLDIGRKKAGAQRSVFFDPLADGLSCRGKSLLSRSSRSDGRGVARETPNQRRWYLSVLNIHAPAVGRAVGVLQEEGLQPFDVVVLHLGCARSMSRQ